MIQLVLVKKKHCLNETRFIDIINNIFLNGRTTEEYNKVIVFVRWDFGRF